MPWTHKSIGIIEGRLLFGSSRLGLTGVPVRTEQGHWPGEIGTLDVTVPVSPHRRGSASRRCFSSNPMTPLTGAFPMLRWALVFALIALIAGGLGFYGLESTAATIARFCALV